MWEAGQWEAAGRNKLPKRLPHCQLIRTGRTRFPMAALHAGMLRGAVAYSTKMHFLGRVAGLAESAEAGDVPGSSVPLQCAQALANALRQRHTDRAVADM